MSSIQLPKGAKIYLPEEAARKRFVEDRLLRVFTAWGYREIVTPSFEYFDVLSIGTDLELQEKMFKLIDRETGRLLALRADVTPQIARIVATRLRDAPRPLRLAYLTNVFRYDEPQVGRYREFYQAGVELVGLEKPEADAEMIAMTVEGLRALGLTRFQIDVGHAEFVRGLLDEIKAEASQTRELQHAIARKDTSAVARLVAEIAPTAHVADALLALPSLVGRDDALGRAARLARNARSERALENLTEVYRLVTVYGLAETVIVDLGEVRGFDYYSGLHFEAYVAGLGASIGAGGRYDGMLGRFGYECPATGFAFEIGRALLAMESQGLAVPQTGPDFFIIDSTPEKTAALSLSRRLRDLGASVARDVVTRGLDESLAYARGQRVRRALVIGAPGMASGQARIIELETGAERELSVAEILEAPQKIVHG